MAHTLEAALDRKEVTGIVAFDGALEVSATTLVLDPEISYERYEQICGFVGQLQRSCQWWAGALANFGEARWGESYVQAIEATGLHYETLSNYAWVERKVHPSVRKSDLSFSHHAEVAKVPPRDQRKWLNKAVKEKLTRSELREVMRVVEVAEEPPVEPEPTLEDAARAVVSQARRGRSSGYYEIPTEPIERLRNALG